MKNLIIAMLALGCITNAQNTEATADQSVNQSTSKIQDLQKKDEQMKDSDEEITNAKLRASVGSKSRVSLRSSVTYSGGTVQKAFSEQRPNITAGNANEDVAELSMNLAMRIRTTDTQSLNLGAGLKVNTPFHKTSEGVLNENGNRQSSVNSPYVEYNFAGKLGAIQNYLQMSYTKTTTDFLTKTVRMTDYVGISHQGIAEVGNFSLGLASSLYKYNYENSGNTFAMGGKNFDRSDMESCLSPFAEYAFNDKYSARTVANWFCFTKNKADSSFKQEIPQSSIGIGIAIARDFYLYPNVQFIPQDVRADRTNVGVTANIYIF